MAISIVTSCKRARTLATASTLLLVVLPGCLNPWLSTGQEIDLPSPLRAPQNASDSVVLEIILARVPRGHEALKAIWESIDETAIDADARRELHRNGIRIGILGGSIPTSLAEILQLEDGLEPPDQTEIAEADPAAASAGQTLTLDDVPTVTRHIHTYRHGRRAAIAASGVLDEIPLLFHDGENLAGRRLRLAQCLYALQPEIEVNQQVRLQLTPEIHHGQARNRFTAGEGMYWRLDTSKDRMVFDELRTVARLGAGQMLVLAATPDCDGSLGHYFHKVASPDGPQDKLILVRLAQIPADLDLLEDETFDELRE